MEEHKLNVPDNEFLCGIMRHKYEKIADITRRTS
jgi:hypothetical protein